MGFSLGSSSSKSNSGNQAYNSLNSTFTPQTQNGVNANNTEADLLGVGGDPTKANAAFQNYLNSSGYKFQLDQGSQAITGNNAAKGLLNSGSTLQSLTQYGQGLGAQYFQSFLNNLQGLTNSGLQAGGLIGSAGQYSNSKSNSNSFGFTF